MYKNHTNVAFFNSHCLFIEETYNIQYNLLRVIDCGRKLIYKINSFIIGSPY